MADDLSAQGSGLRARQTKGSPHAPEELTPTPAVNPRVDIDCLENAFKNPRDTADLVGLYLRGGTVHGLGFDVVAKTQTVV